MGESLFGRDASGERGCSEEKRGQYLVSGVWYNAQAQSFIRFSMGIVLRARGAPVLYGRFWL